MKEDVVVTTITVHSLDQNIIVVSILWFGYLLCLLTVAWRLYRGKQQHDEARGEEVSSSGDTTRSFFYRLLGIALLSRLIFIPLQQFSSGAMMALVSETLPQLAFASAWALLVTFFVHLVGTASTGSTLSSNKPSLLLHIAVYLAYIVLVVWYWWNDAAAVLLYALLCIIYGSLFGTLVYFGPKLIAILQPSLERQSGLQVRLISCCLVGTLVFLLQAISLARTVVTPSAQQHFYITYGIFELLPACLLLVMMHPSQPKQQQDGTPPVPSSNMKRIPSGASNTSATTGMGGTAGTAAAAARQQGKSSTGEMAALLKPTTQQSLYGSNSKEIP